MVKRRSARFVTNQYRNRSFVTDKLEQLKWTPLEDRRKDARLLMLYKIRNQEVNSSASHKLIPPDRISRNTSTNSFQISQCNTTTRKSHSTRRPSVIGIPYPPQLHLSAASNPSRGSRQTHKSIALFLNHHC